MNEQTTSMLNLGGFMVRADQNFLVLEDEPEVNDMISDCLMTYGFIGDVYQAYTIAEAVKLVETKQINYFLCDWNLPDGKGIDLLKAIRKTNRHKHTPFLMVTANADIDSMKLSAQTGGSEYLVKPFKLEDLQEKIIEGWQSHEIRNSDYIGTLERENLKLKKIVIQLKAELDKYKS